MTCRFLSPLSDEQILSAIDGEVTPEILEHLRQCDACRTRFEIEQSLERELMHGLFRIDCPSLDTLRDYAFDVLSADSRLQLTQHVKQCAYCQQDLESMKAYTESSTEQLDPVQPKPGLPLSNWPWVPPHALVGRTSDINAIRGLRGLGAINGILLEAIDLRIALEAEDNDVHGVTLIGQFIVPDLQIWADALVELWQNGRLKRFTVVDETGAFECNAENTNNIRLVMISRNEQVLIFNDIQFPTR